MDIRKLTKTPQMSVEDIVRYGSSEPESQPHGVNGYCDELKNRANQIIAKINGDLKVEIPITEEHVELVIDALSDISISRKWSKGQMSIERRDRARQLTERYKKLSADIIAAGLVGIPDEDGYKIPSGMFRDEFEQGSAFQLLDKIGKTKLKAKAGSKEGAEFAAINWGHRFANLWKISGQNRSAETITIRLLGTDLKGQEINRIQRLENKKNSAEKKELREQEKLAK